MHLLRVSLLFTAWSVLWASLCPDAGAGSVSWDLSGSGDWGVATNWDPVGVPDAGDDVTIDVAGMDITVTLSSGDQAVNSLVSKEALVLSGGALAISSTADLQEDVTLSGTAVSNGVLSLSNDAVLRLNGGSLRDCTVTAVGNAKVVAGDHAANVMNGVTLNGDLDMLTSHSHLMVVDGLELNGTLTLDVFARMVFAGSQSLSGNGAVVFGPNGSYHHKALLLRDAGTTLTLGAGISVQGHSGLVGGFSGWPLYSPEDVYVINQGTILADEPGGTLEVRARRVTNHGTMRAENGGTLQVHNLEDAQGLRAVDGASLWLGGSWTNNGVLSASNATVTLDGVWTNGGVVAVTNTELHVDGTVRTADLGTMSGTGNTVHMQAQLENTGDVLEMDALLGDWTLNGGSMTGGVVNVTPGTALAVLAHADNLLDGVTLNGDLDMLLNSSWLVVTNGLELNGTLTLDVFARVAFAGTQSLSGSGTVVFGPNGSYHHKALLVRDAGTTLTLGAGISVQGHSGLVGGFSGWPLYSPEDVYVVNYGTILADEAGGTLEVRGLQVTNHGEMGTEAGGNLIVPTLENEGLIQAYGTGVLTVVSNLYLFGTAILQGQAHATVVVHGDLLGDTRSRDPSSPTGTLRLDGSGTAGEPQLLEVMGEDIGPDPAGWMHNFAHGVLVIGSSTYVQLVDQSDNADGSGSEALYLDGVIAPEGSTLDLNGLHVYARAVSVHSNAVVTGGIITMLPDGGETLPGLSMHGAISDPGQEDEWTFFGRAGQWITVIARTGHAHSTEPLSPTLEYLEATLRDPVGFTLASGSNTVPGQTVELVNVALPADGTYTVGIRAPAHQPHATGTYILEIWDTTPDGFVAVSLDIKLVLDQAGPMVTLTYPVIGGWNHTVEYLDDLGLGPSWHAMPEAPHNAGSLSDTNVAAQRYYRLRLERP